jgi:MFS family permease
VAGAFTAGLVPAVIGIVADLAPMDHRAHWIGIVSGGASVGWIAGPILGGVFYDLWGYNIAVIISILMGIVTFLTALFTLPETRKNLDRTAKAIGENQVERNANTSRLVNLGYAWNTLKNFLPRSLSAFIVLLGIYFAVMFAWAFIEPSFMFYAYDDLGWNSSMLGLVMSTYGIALMLGDFGLGQLSDRLGRKPVIILGIILFAAQFIGLAFFQNYIWISACFVVAGMGNALFDPALSAAFLDITPAVHQARIQGLKSAAGSLGTIFGPAVAILLTPFLNAQAIFLVAVGAVLLTILMSLLVSANHPHSTR